MSKDIVVGADQIMRYGYVPHGRIRFNAYGNQQWDAVLAHAREIANLGYGRQPADCLFGKWDADGETFVIYDGRHRYLALVGCGYSELLVRWLEPRNAA